MMEQWYYDIISLLIYAFTQWLFVAVLLLAGLCVSPLCICLLLVCSSFVKHAALLTVDVSMFLSVWDYWDATYGKAATSSLKSLDPVYHSALRLITGDSYSTHHGHLYQKVGWQALAVSWDQHWFLLIYKALIQMLPPYIWFLSTLNSCSAPYAWNNLHKALNLDSLPPLRLFKSIISDLVLIDCHCF